MTGDTQEIPCDMVAVSEEVRAARAKWRYRGDVRPPFADTPTAAQESVWDYPRPPRIEADARHIRVMHGTETLADTRAALRVLETASPPTFYLPPDDVNLALLEASTQSTLCEWKGVGRAFDLIASRHGASLSAVAWAYFDVFPEFEAIRGFFAFYPAKVRCMVDGAVVQPQHGGYYGGWVTEEIAGPFKGEAGTEAW